MLVFEPNHHLYYWDGQLVPGVTQLLDGLHSFAGVPWEILDAARERGTAVHEACHYLDRGTLDEDAMRAQAPELWGYIEAWKRFTADCRPEWSGIEEQVYHPLHRFAGTLDRRGSLLYKGVRECGLLDIKTSHADHPAWGLQTAAYDRAAPPDVRPRIRLTCQLRVDGTYRLIPWTDPQDWPAFVSLLTLNTWRTRHGL